MFLTIFFCGHLFIRKYVGEKYEIEKNFLKTCQIIRFSYNTILFFKKYIEMQRYKCLKVANQFDLHI